jgi:uncharacterized surface protein with fasciclin (FAS1) repeats
MKKLTALVLALTALAIPASLAGAQTAKPAASKNLVQTAVAAGQFKTLVKLVKLAGLQSALEGSSKLTVFAPTDAAFAKVPKATINALLANKAELKAVLLYHVLKGEFPAAKILKLKSAKTLEGSSVKFSVTGGAVHVNDAKVIKANVFASNGVIHVINTVLVPPK